MTPLLVLREAAEARSIVAALRARGEAAIAAPCLAFEPVAGARSGLDPWRGRPVDLALTSPRAVEALAGLEVDPAWRVLALAPRTVAAALAAGLPVHEAVPGGAAELARRARPGLPLVAPTSDLGGEELRAARPDAIRVVVYRTVCPARLPEDARAALAGPYALVAASPSALHHLEALAPGAVARAEQVYAWGATTAAAARALGARRITDARGSEPP